jgi:TonB family protein
MLMQYAGIVDLKSGAPNRAIERFRAISAISPADPFALYGEGLAKRMLGSPEAQESVRHALKLDPSVEAYFAEFGVEVPTGLAPADAEPSLIAPRPRPAIDTPPRRRAPLDQKVYDDAYRHFGITSPLEGNVVLECLARSRGAYSDCRILEEAPRNRGLGEMAIRVAAALQVEPATLNGAPVDAVPILVPFTFKIEDQQRDR